MKLIGLTGGIASGKSTVAAIFRELGARVIDADQVAREVVEPGGEALEEIVAEFGRAVLKSDGTLDREVLASVVFHDPASRQRLEEITHPRILARTLEVAWDYFRRGAIVVIVEAALIGESRHDPKFDAVILVVTAHDTQVERLMGHRKLSAEEVLARLSSQKPAGLKMGVADHVIDNTGSLEETKRQVESLWRELTESKG